MQSTAICRKQISVSDVKVAETKPIELPDDVLARHIEESQITAFRRLAIPILIQVYFNRRTLLVRGPQALQRALPRMQPVSLVALLTLVLLFGFQGGQILSQPLIILMPDLGDDHRNDDKQHDREKEGFPRYRDRRDAEQARRRTP